MLFYKLFKSKNRTAGQILCKNRAKPGTGGLSAAASDGRMILDLIDYISIYNVKMLRLKGL